MRCDYCERDVFHCKRCGVCRQRQYCSPQCQKDDWVEGHRDDCGKDKGLPFSNPKPAALVAQRSTGEIEDGVFLDRLTEQELHTWNNLAYWTENEKHLLAELWTTFDRDGQVPIEDPESRSVREMFKWLGSQPRFHFLAPVGREWVGRYENNGDEPHARQNKEILTWVQKLLKKSNMPVDQDLDFTDFIKLVLRRRYDYIMESRKA